MPKPLTATKNPSSAWEQGGRDGYRTGRLAAVELAVVVSVDGAMSVSDGMGDKFDRPWVKVLPDGFNLQVVVRPDAPRSRIVGIDERGLVIALGAPAQKGKANRELRYFLAGVLGIGVSRVQIVQGERARTKLVKVETDDAEGGIGRLHAFCAKKQGL